MKVWREEAIIMHISYEVTDYTIGHYQDKAPVRACARPWKMIHDEKTAKAVLCLHGYAGYPGELVRPGIDLYGAGFDVYAVRYPGHGTCGSDFAASTLGDWLGTAYDACKELAGRYEELYVVGHSMGGAMAVELAAAFNLKRMVLLAPGLLIPSLSMWKLRLVKLLKGGKPIPQSWQSDPGYKLFYEGSPDDDAFLGSQYWSWVYPVQLMEMEKLRRMAVASLEHLETDTLVIMGGKDHIVDPSVADLVLKEGRGRNRKLVLENCTHFIPYDKDFEARDIALAETVKWLSQD